MRPRLLANLQKGVNTTWHLLHPLVGQLQLSGALRLAPPLAGSVSSTQVGQLRVAIHLYQLTHLGPSSGKDSNVAARRFASVCKVS